MKILRDKSFSTKILILNEIYNKKYSKLSSIADKIGITQQAVSDYVKKMKKEQLVEKFEGEYKLTIKGVYILQTEMIALKNFVDEKVKKLSLVNECIAISKTAINMGDTVGLFMEEGWLIAYANKKSNSIGIAKNDCRAREHVLIGNLEGIVDLEIGKIYFFELPNPFKSKNKNVDETKIREKLHTINVDKIGILDTYSKTICDSNNIKYDFEFDATSSSLDAACRGLDTVLFGYSDIIKQEFYNFKDMLDSLDKDIKYDFIQI